MKHSFSSLNFKMYYSFDFAANVTRLCIEEIRNRGKYMAKYI